MAAVHEKDAAVLAYHGPLLYEAHVLESAEKTAPGGTKIRLYFVHFEGWSSHWDEWVPASRVLPSNEHSLKLQKERLKEFNRANKKRVRGLADASAPVGAPVIAEKKKLTTDKEKDKGGEDLLVAEIREQLRLPQGMKLRLIEDWERIARERKLVPVPRRPSIATLLEDFVATKAKRNSHERLYNEVCDGLRSYFNQALGSLLLYKYERKQFRDVREEHKNVPLVELYGAEHLLRLFVKLPELLAHCKLQREHMVVLISKLIELLKFLQLHKGKYFVGEFESPSDEYLQWWGGEEGERA